MMVAPFCAQVQHDVFDQRGIYRVEAGKRFVENQKRRPVSHRGDELRLLLHALGKIVDLLFRPGGQSQPLQPFVDSHGRFRFAQSFQRREKNQNLAHLHPGVQAPLLGKIADQVLRAVAGGLPKHLDGALIGGQDVHDHPQRGGFAGAIGAEQSKNRSLLDVQAEVGHRHDRVKALGDMFDGNGFHR